LSKAPSLQVITPDAKTVLKADLLQTVIESLCFGNGAKNSWWI
jgi:hypothetical protein